MFDDLVDPEPPEPTTEVREAVTRRAGAILRHRRAAVAAGGLAAVALVVTGSFALFGGDDASTQLATEVRGAQEVHPDATTTTTTTAPPEPASIPAAPADPPAGEAEAPPPPPPASPPPAAAATLAGEVVLPTGFTVTGCTLNGAPLALAGNTFTVADLAPGQRVEIVCEATSGTGAARAARVVVDLQPGTNSVRVAL